MSLSFGTDGVRGRRQHRAHPRARARPRPGHGARPRPDARASSSAATPAGPGRCSRRRSSPASPPRASTPCCSAWRPTPAVAWVSADAGIPGAVISASHNPFADNGIKLFAAGGRKLDRRGRGGRRGRPRRRLQPAAGRPTGAGVGTVARHRRPRRRLAGRGRRHARGPPPRRPARRRRLRQRRGVAGRPPSSSTRSAPTSSVLEADRPDGTNINDGVRRHPPRGARAAPSSTRGADLGLALDGDADRLHRRRRHRRASSTATRSSPCCALDRREPRRAGRTTPWSSR